MTFISVAIGAFLFIGMVMEYYLYRQGQIEEINLVLGQQNHLSQRITKLTLLIQNDLYIAT